MGSCTCSERAWVKLSPSTRPMTMMPRGGPPPSLSKMGWAAMRTGP